MPLNRAACPECRAVATSEDGFTVGEVVTCPKCGTYFDVQAPPPPAAPVPAKPVAAKPVVKRPVAEVEDVDIVDDEPVKPVKKRRREDDDDYDRPQMKKKRRREDDEDDDYDDRPRKSKKGYAAYKSSPVRFVILGVLVVVMLVMAFFLYQKMQRDRENSRHPLPPACAAFRV